MKTVLFILTLSLSTFASAMRFDSKYDDAKSIEAILKRLPNTRGDLMAKSLAAGKPIKVTHIAMTGVDTAQGCEMSMAILLSVGDKSTNENFYETTQTICLGMSQR